MVLIEEARPIIKWESIKEHLRNELHDRSVSEQSSTNPLRNLNEEQMKNLKFLYERLTPVIRTLFIGMSALQLLWDVMLVGTMLYYHRMVEKFISGIIAIFTWYFTYRFWYRSPIVLPDPAGSGEFLYQRENKDSYVFKRTNSMTSAPKNMPSTSGGIRSGATATTQSQVPKFMGMPLYTSPKSSNFNSQIANSNNDAM